MARITVPTVENLMNELGLIFQKTYSNDFKVDKIPENVKCEVLD